MKKINSEIRRKVADILFKHLCNFEEEIKQTHCLEGVIEAEFEFQDKDNNNMDGWVIHFIRNK